VCAQQCLTACRHCSCRTAAVVIINNEHSGILDCISSIDFLDFSQDRTTIGVAAVESNHSLYCSYSDNLTQSSRIDRIDDTHGLPGLQNRHHRNDDYCIVKRLFLNDGIKTLSGNRFYYILGVMSKGFDKLYMHVHNFCVRL
jgi:hypothetical protein